jgi:hypothetical protein
MHRSRDQFVGWRIAWRGPKRPFTHTPPRLNHTLSAANASDLLPNGPSTGSPDGPMSAHQLPSEPRDLPMVAPIAATLAGHSYHFI